MGKEIGVYYAAKVPSWTRAAMWHALYPFSYQGAPITSSSLMLAWCVTALKNTRQSAF